MSADAPVSIGIPVRNGEDRISHAIRSVLAQDFADLELVISDNASTDGTEDVCRESPRDDHRVVYHRQPENIGLLNNFIAVMQLAGGELFSWVGDDDTLEPTYVSRCASVLHADDHLLLVTAQTRVTGPDGVAETARYEGDALASDDPLERFIEMLRLLNQDLVVIDPLSGLLRRRPVAAIPRKNMLREDQIYATKLAFAGPWGHVPDVLSNCVFDNVSRPVLARRLGVPVWQSKVATALQLGELLRVVQDLPLTAQQKWRARGRRCSSGTSVGTADESSARHRA